MTSKRAPQLARICCSWAPREAVLIGTQTAPSQAQPRKTSMNSMRFDAISATRSAGRIPAACNAAADRAATSQASAKLKLRPLAATSGFCAKRSA